jgi:hypothetical protein
MTVTTESAITPIYNGTGLVDTYAYNFKVNTEDDLVVKMRDTSGTESTLVLNTDYTLTGVGEASGGDIVLSSSLVLNYKLVAYLDLDYTQETDLTNQESIFLQSLEDICDNNTRLVQQLKAKLDLGVYKEVTDSSDIPTFTEIADYATAAANSASAAAASAASVQQSWKTYVACKTTANINLSGEQTLDGVLTSGSRVLVSEQTDQSENGIYVSAAGAWSRATDFDSVVDVNGAVISVNGGTLYTGTIWRQTQTITALGTDNIIFENRLDKTLSYIADNGLDVDTISEATTGTGVTIDGVLLKDSEVNTDTINESTTGSGVTIDSVLLKDGELSTDTINELSTGTGITIDGVLLKDGEVNTDIINEATSGTGVTIDGLLIKDGIIPGSSMNWIRGELVGSGLSISTGIPALAALNGTDVAFIDATNDELRTYRFNGSTWSLVGSGLSISTAGNPALTALNGTDVAFIDDTNDELRTYRFNGSTWSLVGSGLSISTAGYASLTALNGTDVAFIDDTNDELRTYRFNGSTWSLVGSGLSISAGTTALAALNGTDVAFIDGTNDELRTYRFNGSTWSLVGSGLSISSTLFPDIAALNGTDVAFIDNGNNELRTYRFNGSTWSLVGSGLSISVSNPAISALNGTDVAFIDATNDELRTYRFSFYIGEGPYRPS